MHQKCVTGQYFILHRALNEDILHVYLLTGLVGAMVEWET